MKRFLIAISVVSFVVTGTLAHANSWYWLIPFSEKKIASLGKHCVHGFEGNFGHVCIYYRGDAATFHKEVFKKVAEPKSVTSKKTGLIPVNIEELRPAVKSRKTVILHPGSARIPDYLSKQQPTYDWSIQTWFDLQDKSHQQMTQIDIWLGGEIKLEDLKIPDDYEVKSDGTIEKFLEKRKKRPTPPAAAKD